jgi:tetratricopeptide (TPR) repeat protein
MGNWTRLAFVALGLLAGHIATADEKPWAEVRSPHFRIITNGNDHAAAHVARELEQMRSLFAMEFPGFALDSASPLLVLAPHDEYTALQLVPAWRKLGNTKIAGFYHHGWDKEYALVRLDQVGSDRVNPDTYGVVYHEYVHSLLHDNFHWLPRWLDEGLAEFYEYTRFEGSHIYIGAPPKNRNFLEALDRRSAIPLEEFIEQNSFVSRDAEQTHMFYAEAWALTHFLTFGPGMEQGDKLKRFFNALQKGKAQKAAFVETFGSFDEVNKAFSQYLLKFSYTSANVPNPSPVDEKTFVARTMSQAETEAELAEFHIWMREWKEARDEAEAAVKHDSKLALGQEALGFIDLHDGRAGDAARQFANAFALDGNLYLSFFAKTMLLPAVQSHSPADMEALKQELLKITLLKPDFAPAYIQLAKVYLAQDDLQKAFTSSRKAEGLAPFRAGYHLLSGQILLRMGDPAKSSSYASYVADRWGFPDRDEAIELWNATPMKSRQGDPPREPSFGNGVETAEGVVESTRCNTEELAITLMIGGKERTFRGTGPPYGFSDTLWLGRDHFTPCFYVKGLRTVVRYRATPGKADAELVNAGFRDDLPQEQKKELSANAP